jgi:hypothetical protein
MWTKCEINCDTQKLIARKKDSKSNWIEFEVKKIKMSKIYK